MVRKVCLEAAAGTRRAALRCAARSVSTAVIWDTTTQKCLCSFLKVQ